VIKIEAPHRGSTGAATALSQNGRARREDALVFLLLNSLQEREKEWTLELKSPSGRGHVRGETGEGNDFFVKPGGRWWWGRHLGTGGDGTRLGHSARGALPVAIN